MLRDTVIYQMGLVGGDAVACQCMGTSALEQLTAEQMP